MAPTLLTGSSKRNVMPARAAVELDCRILPGHHRGRRRARVRARLGSDVPYELEWPEALVAGSASSTATGLMDAIAARAGRLGRRGRAAADAVHRLHGLGLPPRGGHADGVRLQPVPVHLAEVLTAGFHNADERVHVDDLLLSVEFHVALARDLLGPDDRAGGVPA